MLYNKVYEYTKGKSAVSSDYKLGSQEQIELAILLRQYEIIQSPKNIEHIYADTRKPSFYIYDGLSEEFNSLIWPVYV